MQIIANTDSTMMTVMNINHYDVQSCKNHCDEHSYSKRFDERSFIVSATFSKPDCNLTQNDNFNVNNSHLTPSAAKKRTKCTQTNAYISSTTPRKTLLRKKLHYFVVENKRFKKHLSKIKTKYTRKFFSYNHTRNNSIKAVIDTVGKYLSGECLSFVTHQLRMSNRHTNGRRYTNEIRLLAINLHNASPKAYKYLAKIFTLPSKISLIRWLNNLKCSPGFHAESFSGFAERLKYMTDRDKTCSLLIDEISLKAHLQYVRHDDIIVGYEDTGTYGQRSNNIARYALVFMLRGLAANWTQPLGYVFTSSACQADVVKTMLFDCLDKCKVAGAFVKVVLSDQGPNFQSLVNKLGISTNEPYFFHNGSKYFYMYDPPHLIKSIRNNLYKYTFQFDKNKIAKWDIKQKFFVRDSKENIRLCPKLTEQHIKLEGFSKMKVKFATQIFSRTLAAGLNLLAPLLGKEAKTTAEFVFKFNDLFDVMNSSQMSTSNPNLCALKDGSLHMKFIHNFKQWLNTLTILKGTSVMNKKIKCISGWQLTLTAVEQLWPVLRDSHGFDFLLTQRLNTDPIENLFSEIRQKGGNCSNPTPYNFARIIKQVTCQRLFNPIEGGNCELDLTKILVAISSKEEAKLVTLPVGRSKLKVNQNDNANVSMLQTALIYPNIPNFNVENQKLLEGNAIHYVAGYLLKKILMWHKCFICENILKASANLPKINEMFLKLKAYKQNSKLQNVSQSFHSYITILEQKLIDIFDKNCFKKNIGSHIVNELLAITVPTACKTFPKTKFLQLFVRMRIYYLLKFSNAVRKAQKISDSSACTSVARKKLKKLINC